MASHPTQITPWLAACVLLAMLDPNIAVAGDVSSDVARTTFDLGESFDPACFCFSNGNQLFALADYRNGAVKLYDLRDLKLQTTLSGFPQERGLTAFSTVRFSPDDTRLGVVCAGPRFSILDIRRRKEVFAFSPKCDNCWSTAVSSDLSVLAVGERWNISLWEPEQRRQSRVIEAKYPYYVWSLAFNHTGDCIASTSPWQFSWPKVWNVKDGSEAVQLEGMGTYEHVYEKNGRQLTAILPRSDVNWSSIVFSLDDTMVAAVGSRVHGDESGRVTRSAVARVWNVVSGKTSWNLEVPGRIFRAIAVDSVRNRVFVVGGTQLPRAKEADPYGVMVYALDTGHKLFQLNGHTNTVHTLHVSLDGRWVATSGNDATVRLWDVHLDLDKPRSGD
ncbi:MAG: hypothetical protein FJ276_00670 [Planctomycetes bacterium]|nr:hypothetical protein [Planctomycetota bacterium]